MARQAPNVRRMRLLVAEVRPVDSCARTLKDAINGPCAIGDNVATHTSCASFWARILPMMVRTFSRVV